MGERHLNTIVELELALEASMESMRFVDIGCCKMAMNYRNGRIAELIGDSDKRRRTI
ncbi:hypothetical protein H5410_004839 [Solanum commersonii]|uniref:Uncharacterized protein n=1 Tax=Solanum commersonii TaxID=4109 RepID=A0A9J6A4Y6_SOLCO|nr:hypothetical protein H5410_004839 [Solanum commersonii]